MDISKNKKTLIIIAIAFGLFFSIVFMSIRFSNGIGMNKETKKYERLAIEYTIEHLKANDAYNPNITYRVDKVYYLGKDNSDDKIPYSTIKFQIGDNSGFIVIMEKNSLGEFEIIDFKSFD